MFYFCNISMRLWGLQLNVVFFYFFYFFIFSVSRKPFNCWHSSSTPFPAPVRIYLFGYGMCNQSVVRSYWMVRVSYEIWRMLVNLLSWSLWQEKLPAGWEIYLMWRKIPWVWNLHSTEYVLGEPSHWEVCSWWALRSKHREAVALSFSSALFL